MSKTINEMVFGKDKNNKYPGSKMKSIITQNAIFKTNKLEVVPFAIESEKVNEILNFSGFNQLRRKLSRTLIEKGEAALALLPHQDTYIIVVLNDLTYSTIGKQEEWVVGTSGSTVVVNGQELAVWTKLYYKEGLPTVNRFVKLPDSEDGEIMVTVEDITYPTTLLPVELFFNNELKLSDVDYFDVKETLERLDYMDKELIPEFELNRSMPSFNTNYTDNDPATETKQLKEGRGWMAETSYASQTREGTIIIPSNGAYMLLQQAVDHEEAEIREKMAMIDLPGAEKGTNKHTAEIIYKAEYVIDVLLSYQDIRNDHYNQFFFKMAKLLGETPFKVQLELNPITQSKIDLLHAAIEAEQAKAKKGRANMQNPQPKVGDE